MMVLRSIVSFFLTKRDMRLELHIIISNESNRSLTIVRPSVIFDHKGYLGEFSFFRIETGSGRKSITMSKGRTAIVTVTFGVEAKLAVEEYAFLEGTLVLRIAEPGFGEYRYPFVVLLNPNR